MGLEMGYFLMTWMGGIGTIKSPLIFFRNSGFQVLFQRERESVCVCVFNEEGKKREKASNDE